MGLTSVGIDTTEGIRIEEDGVNGPFVVLHSLGSAPDAETIYRVSLAEEPDGRWYALVPLLSSCRAYGATRAAAKNALAASIRDYLRARADFIRDAAPLIPTHILTETGGSGHATLRNSGIPVWHVIAAMGNAVAASVLGDDALMIAPERIAETATALNLPMDTVRASVAYFMEHKREIRAAIAADSIARLDAAFEQLQRESGLTAEELARAFQMSDDAA